MASIVEFGNFFRLLVNEVEAIPSPALPRLPLASVLWTPLPNLKDGGRTEWPSFHPDDV